MKPPKISVIVPIYNVETYIGQCLDSIVNQTLHDIEIICIDDCGTDKSMQIVEQYAKSDSRIKIIRHAQNAGLSASRNTGIDNSSAPYIMCCDSDDYYAPTMCEQMLAAITENNVDIAMCGTEVIYEADEQLKESDDWYYGLHHKGAVQVYDWIILECNVNAWNKIYKRDILNKYKIRFPVGLKYEDAFFFRAYMMWAQTIAFVDDKLYCYRRRVGSIMNETFKGTTNFAVDHVKIAVAFYEYLKKWNLYSDKYIFFWRDFFVPYVKLAIWNTHSASAIRKTYKLAGDLIRKAYIKNTTDPETDRQIQQIRHQTFHKSRKFLFGLFAIKETDNKTELRIIGIPLYVIKFRTRRTKHYFCGIHLFNRRKFTKTHLSIPTLNEMRLDSTQILAALQTVPNFTYIPNAGNMGDMLIAFATLGFLDEHKIQYKMFDNKNADYIVYGGGGIWTADYQQYWEKFLPIFQAAKRVVILPSSFNNCQKLVDILDSRFTVFCREKQSYDYLVKQKTDAKIILDHDMAFRITNQMIKQDIKLDHDELSLYVNLHFYPFGKTVWFTRRDCESAGDYQSDMDLSSLSYGSELAPRQWIDANALLMLDTVSRTHTVITDRLHVGIAAMLTGREVYLLDNSYKKLSNVYKHTMKSCKNVHFGYDIPKAK